MNIVWVCAIDPSGYSSCGRAYIKALYENNRCSVNMMVTNVARNINLEGINKSDIDFFSNLSIKTSKNHKNIIHHCVPDRMVFSIKKKNILYTVCEMDIPSRWISICNSCDLIMTPSRYSLNKFVESGVNKEKIHVVPHCHDTDLWNPYIGKLNIGNLKGFNFLFVGDYTSRKGGDLLIKSFIKAFEGNRDVSLTIKGYFNSFSKRDQAKLYSKIKNIATSCGVLKEDLPTIYFYGDPIPENLMPRFMNSFDCLVSPHRCEGWGLSCSQMMFLGKPVIATGFSGNLEFMNSKNSFLIEIDGFDDVDDEMVKINPNFKGKRWCKLNQDDLIDKMKYVVVNREESNKKGQFAYEDLKSKFSSKIISNQIVDLVGNL